MTLPASGTISLSHVNVEVGAGAGAKRDLNWVRSITKGGANPFAMSFLYGKAYFQSSKDGNCANGNCAQDFANCGNINCRNCVITGAVNCANCDASAYIQPNCNCACTYNCTSTTTSYNCNCACDCGGRC